MLFGIWSDRLLMAVTPYADQMRFSATRGPTVTSRTAINIFEGRHSNNTIKKRESWVFPSFPGFLLPNDR
jgi:hypothetical protein